MRKIVCLTGTRADYGYLKPVMKEIEKSEELELVVIATGMHFFEKFGNTIKEIKKDFPKVVEVPVELQEDSGYGTTNYIAESIKKLSKIFREIKPDFCLVLGDRTETFAGVQAAFYQNIPIAHMHGGDISSGWDEPTRHVITKFAHIHFPATKKSADRIKKMGEQPWRIYIVGSSTLDELLTCELPEKKYLLIKYGLDPEKPFLLGVQHSTTSNKQTLSESETQIKEIIKAISETNIQAIFSSPNVDEGGQTMIEIIKQNENIKFLPNIERKDYLGLLKYTSCLIGNSSSGVIEAPTFKTPFVNIGTRQKGRECAENVINVFDFEKEKILNAINYSLYDSEFRVKLKNCKNPYGDGKTGKRICEILSQTEINEELLQKRIVFDEKIERFKEWVKPEIDEGKLTKWNWMVQGKEGLKLGDKIDIGAFTYINAKYEVEIGDEVEIGSHCSIYSESTIDKKKGKVIIGNNVKIGTHSTIMPGVTIGENSIIGAHSFVNKDIPNNVIAYGVPAKIKKKYKSF